MRKLTSLILVVGLLVLQPASIAKAEWQTTTNWRYSQDVTVGATSVTLVTSISPVTAPTRLISQKTGALSVELMSGDTAYINPNPDGRAPTVSTTDNIVLTAAQPRYELAVWSTNSLKAISAGTSVVRWEVLVSK